MGIGARGRTSAARVVALLSLAALTAAAPASGHPDPTRQRVNPLPVQQAIEPPLAPTEAAECGPGSMPETALQGQVPIADHASGRAAKGYTCNAELVGRYGKPRPAGHDRRVQGRALRRLRRARVRVLRHHPARPDQPDRRRGRGQRARHVGPGESGAHRQADHAGDALAARVAGREPEARACSPRCSATRPSTRGSSTSTTSRPTAATRCSRSSTPAGVLGHESGMAPDGRTFYSASPSTQTLVAVDISNLSAPVPLWIGPYDSHGLSISDDGNRAYVAGVDSGLIVLDVSEIQARKPEPAGARGRAPSVGLDEHPAERDPGDHRRPPLRGRDRRVRDPRGAARGLVLQRSSRASGVRHPHPGTRARSPTSTRPRGEIWYSDGFQFSVRLTNASGTPAGRRAGSPLAAAPTGCAKAGATGSRAGGPLRDGNDRVAGGAGRDRIDCGRGRDHAVAGAGDRVRRCERVRRVT